MILPNLLFSDNNNYLQWCDDSYDWRQTRNGLNLSDILRSLKFISFDFPEEYLYKPCINIDDAEYRLDIMNELFSSPAFFRAYLNLTFH